MGTALDIGIQATRAVGLVVSEVASNREKFARLHVVPLLCHAMRRWSESTAMQQAAVFALRPFLESPPLAVEAIRLDAPRLLNDAVRNHPGLADLQGNSAKAMQSMAAQHEEWKMYQMRQSRQSCDASDSRLLASMPTQPSTAEGCTAAHLWTG